MSVIFGIKEEDKIIIAGDKRGSTKEGGFLTDDLCKVVVINENLAFVSAGNLSIQTSIQMDLKKIICKEKLTTEDLLDIIKAFYQNAKEYKSNRILDMPFSFIIAGKSRDNLASLISGSNFKRNLTAQEVAMALYPPADVKNEKCCNIFVENYKLHHSEFVELTISNISEISKLVSAVGDKWIFDIKTQKGNLA